MERSRHDADFLDWWVEVNEFFTKCETDDERFSRVDAEIRNLGFDCYAYTCRSPVPFNQHKTAVIGSYPQQWLALYNERDYGSVDLSIARARDVGLVVWAEHKDLLRSPIFLEARNWHLNVGATFMMRGRDQSVHILGVSRRSEAISPNEGLLLKLKLRCVTELIEDHCKPQRSGDLEISLTAREVEILRWIADGKCSKGVSEILSLSEHTVNFHVKSIQRKFGSSNRTLAAAYAVALGVL